MKLFFQYKKEFFIRHRDDLIFFAWIFLPVMTVILFHSTVFDEWRHMLFVYGGFVGVSLIGINGVYEFFKQRLSVKYKQFFCRLWTGVIVLSLLQVAFVMMRYHPYQNVYFNRLAGSDLEEIKKRFELDYWGLSYRRALEYIVSHDFDPIIKLYVINSAGRTSAWLLKEEDRRRLRFVQRPQDAKYFISNYRGHNYEYNFPNEFYYLKVNGTKIMVVYKLQ